MDILTLKIKKMINFFLFHNRIHLYCFKFPLSHIIIIIIVCHVIIFMLMRLFCIYLKYKIYMKIIVLRYTTADGIVNSIDFILFIYVYFS